MIYLYIKAHNATGMKYLGITKRDPFKYKGSGKYWQRHLKKHGYDVSTSILLVTEDKQEIRDTGLFFSNLFNVVDSEEWANLVPEEGEGGHNLKHTKRTPEWNRKVGDSAKGRPAHNKDTICWNNGNENVFSKELPGEDFVVGILRPKHPGKTKGSSGRKWYTNGTENILSFDCPDGFWSGRAGLPSHPLKGKKSDFRWWNNGSENKRSIETPGENWKLGRLNWL